MRLFFYAASPRTAADKYYQQISNWQSIPECKELPAGGGFNTPLAFQLSSGDVLLLFAGDHVDMQHLQRLSDDLEDFQVILILESSSPEIADNGYSIRPRFICRGMEDAPLLKQLLTKIFTPPDRPGCRRGPSRRQDVPTNSTDS